MANFFFCQSQSLIEKWQTEKLQIEKSINSIESAYLKDTTNLKIKDSLSKLNQQQVLLERNLAQGYHELDLLITGVYGKNQKSDGDTNSLGFKQMLTWDNILLLIVTLIALFLLADNLIINNKKKRRDDFITALTGNKHVDGINRLKEWQNQLVEKASQEASHNSSEIINLKSKNSVLEQKFLDLRNQLTVLEKQFKESPARMTENNPSALKSQSNSGKILYADAIVNGEFNRVTGQPNDDTVYELSIKANSPKEADFTIHPDAFRRVLKNADFIDGCDKQRLNMNPGNLEIIKGNAALLENGKWQITKKAEVKFV